MVTFSLLNTEDIYVVSCVKYNLISLTNTNTNKKNKNSLQKHKKVILA